MNTASYSVPDALHLCPRCGDLASGSRLCSECQASIRAAAVVMRELRRMRRRELLERRFTSVRKLRDLAAVCLLYLGFSLYLGCIAAIAVRAWLWIHAR